MQLTLKEQKASSKVQKRTALMVPLKFLEQCLSSLTSEIPPVKVEPFNAPSQFINKSRVLAYPSIPTEPTTLL